MMSDPIPEVTIPDVIDPARINALAVTLELDKCYGPGDPMPPFAHQIYFWEPFPNPQLGHDGHPKPGLAGIIPDLGLPNRMWAGGRLRFTAPFRAGIAAERRSLVENAELKQGRRGQLGFVTLRHEIWQDGTLCVTEHQDIVYLNPPAPDAAKPAPEPAPTQAEVTRTRRFSSTDLFRYSALTFNGHRIHYDLDHARGPEGYDHLVVHGPLLAQMLMLLAQETYGSLGTFQFRAKSPVMCGEEVTFCLNGPQLWVRGENGRLCMSASAEA